VGAQRARNIDFVMPEGKAEQPSTIAHLVALRKLREWTLVIFTASADCPVGLLEETSASHVSHIETQGRLKA
jgi:hypothetical protein